MNKIITPEQDSERQQIVNVFEQGLEQAKAGNIEAVAVVACMKGGFAKLVGGSDAARLMLGMESLKQDILKAVEMPAPNGGGRIMRVR